MAVPASVSLDDVADRVHLMGLAVQLSGWNPPEEDGQRKS
jgi:hypothetical protein